MRPERYDRSNYDSNGPVNSSQTVQWAIGIIVTVIIGYLSIWAAIDPQRFKEVIGYKQPTPTPSPTATPLPDKVTVQVQQMLYTVNGGAPQPISNTLATLKTQKEVISTTPDGQGVAWFTGVPCNSKFLGITFDNTTIGGYEVPAGSPVAYTPSRPGSFPCQNAPIVWEKFIVHLTVATTSPTKQEVIDIPDGPFAKPDCANNWRGCVEPKPGVITIPKGSAKCGEDWQARCAPKTAIADEPVILPPRAPSPIVFSPNTNFYTHNSFGERPIQPSLLLSKYTSPDGAVVAQIPSNWDMVSAGKGNLMVFAPPKGYGQAPVIGLGSPVVSHGVFLCLDVPSSSDLRAATTTLVQQQLKDSPTFRVVKPAESINFGGRTGYVAAISGPSPCPGATEVNVTYATTMADGRLFYIVTIVPEDEQQSYKPAFEQIIRSLRLAN